MKISEYIKELEAIRNEHGDLTVKRYSFDGNAFDVAAPEIGFMKILKGRQREIVFWRSWEPEEQKGEKVCRIT